MKKKVIHHPSLCIGCGGCSSLCPKLFKLNEETGIAELIDGKKINEDEFVRENIDESECQDLDMVCSQGAIEVEDQN